jgi:glycosyltransferase involved in cell wall biosynthesis
MNVAATAPPPKVSVCVVTYNHVRFVAGCLQALLEQQTPFDFEIIVGDDGSTDGTAEVVRQFAERHPDRITAVLHPKNLGPTPNWLSVHRLARGEYVSHIDGDDYALPGKLRALAEVLDADPGCIIAWHRMYVLNEHGQSAIGMPQVPPRTLFGKDTVDVRDAALFYGHIGCQSGSMYRRSAMRLDLITGEVLDYWIVLSLLARGGHARYIEPALGVYRLYLNQGTITRDKGDLPVGHGKLRIFRDWAHLGPEVRRHFAAQAVFEAFKRAWFRQPMIGTFLLEPFRLGAIPRPADLRRIWRVFNAHRYSGLVRRWRPHAEVEAASRDASA